jgi:hypothetical protein
MSNDNIQSLCLVRATKQQFRLCRSLISSLVHSEVVEVPDSSDSEDIINDLGLVQEQASIRDMDLFALTSTSEFFTPLYGSSGDSTLFSVKNALTLQRTLEVYLQLQADQAPGVCSDAPRSRVRSRARFRVRSRDRCTARSRVRSRVSSRVRSRSRARSRVKSRVRYRVRPRVRSRVRSLVRSRARSRVRSKLRSGASYRSRVRSVCGAVCLLFVCEVCAIIRSPPR